MNSKTAQEIFHSEPRSGSFAQNQTKLEKQQNNPRSDIARNQRKYMTSLKHLDKKLYHRKESVLKVSLLTPSKATESKMRVTQQSALE